MKKIVIFLITFLLVIIVNGNADEKIPIDLVSFENLSPVGEIHNIKANTNSEPGLEQNKDSVPEQINMLALGASLIGIGAFIRKKLSYR